MEMNARKPPCGPVSRDSDARVAATWAGVLAATSDPSAGTAASEDSPRSMVADHLIGIDKLETDLWKLAEALGPPGVRDGSAQ